MNILLALAPFIAFAFVDRFLGSFEGLISGTVAAAVLLLRDVLAHRPLKILEIGTLILFAGLTLYVALSDVSLSVMAVRIMVDTGLLLIVLASILLRRPFTLQYAKEGVSPEVASSTEFLRTNYVISGAWAAAFAVIVVADILLFAAPSVSSHFGVWIIILALVGAVKFTAWYPKRARAAHPASF
ncbi:hypothetical protein NDN16_08020 [Aureimonas altamirensis]|uniref:hypothetical protein n=1 Tax=Aureimonas altamirensis TaxID=370622 RepID=UPI00203765C0|nr:hypothetical protein [Aureimonas altamirensis]MCM2503621.1 hypothetical protein [Aureimonas altamirensis]